MKMSQTHIDTFFKTRKRPAEPVTKDLKTVKELSCDVNKSTQNVIVTPSASPTKKTSQQEIKEPSQCNNNEERSNILVTPKASLEAKKKLQQELGLGEFRRIIHKSKRLDDIKKSLKIIKTETNRAKKLRRKLNLSDCDDESEDEDNDDRNQPRPLSFDIDDFPTRNGLHLSPLPIRPLLASPRKCLKGPSTTPRKLHFGASLESPVKAYESPTKLLNEYEAKTPTKSRLSNQFSHLVATKRDGLILPFAYSTLKEIFRGVDIIVKIMTDRGETCTFSKLKPDVQKMVRKNFTETNLAQMLTVLPGCYELKREKMRMPLLSSAERYELVISFPSKDKVTDDGKFMLERLKSFHNQLLSLALHHHEQFLLGLEPPVVVESSKVKRWHPEFDVDGVPDITPSPIPQPSDTTKCVSAKATLELERNIRMNRALSHLKNAPRIDQMKDKVDGKGDRVQDELVTPTPFSVNNSCPKKSNMERPPVAESVASLKKALKGIPAALMEKIRKKQAANCIDAVTQSPEVVKEKLVLSRLPELAKIIRNIFVIEKKYVLPLSVIIRKIGHSYSEKISSRELIEHLKAISKHVPGWLNFHIVRNVEYARLSKDADLTRIVSKLERIVIKNQETQAW